jgi:hypothetical protein
LFNSRFRQEREHWLHLQVEMTQTTTSESFFEQFCTQHGVRWEPIATEGTTGVKTPDYAIFPKNMKVITKIKEIRESNGATAEKTTCGSWMEHVW